MGEVTQRGPLLRSARPARRRDRGHRPVRRQHSGASLRFRAARRRGARGSMPATRCTRASTSATGCRSTCRGWPRKAVAGRSSSSTRSRSRRRPLELAAQLRDGSTPLDHALGDGEDFELILAVPAEAAERLLAEQPLGCRCTRIGTFVAERGLVANRRRRPAQAACAARIRTSAGSMSEHVTDFSGCRRGGHRTPGPSAGRAL